MLLISASGMALMVKPVFSIRNNRIHGDMGAKTKAKFICALRIIYFISCGCIFVYLIRELYKSFTGNKVILTSSDDYLQDNQLLAPILAICSNKPLRDHAKPMFNLQEYMENSVNVSEKILMGYSAINIQGATIDTFKPYVSTYLEFL